MRVSAAVLRFARAGHGAVALLDTLGKEEKFFFTLAAPHIKEASS